MYKGQTCSVKSITDQRPKKKWNLDGCQEVMCSVEGHYVKDSHNCLPQREGAWVLNYLTSTEEKKTTHTPSQNLKKDPRWKVNRKPGDPEM